jgi:hypothetical protein
MARDHPAGGLPQAYRAETVQPAWLTVHCSRVTRLLWDISTLTANRAVTRLPIIGTRAMGRSGAIARG